MLLPLQSEVSTFGKEREVNFCKMLCVGEACIRYSSYMRILEWAER